MSLQLEWISLRQCAMEQLRRLGPCSIDCPKADLLEWDDMVLRFRKLREALTAAHADASLCCEVYELSAVVCAAARNMAELLKCLQQLVNKHHPTVSKQQQQQQYRRSAAPDTVKAVAHYGSQHHQQQDNRAAAVEKDPVHDPVTASQDLQQQQQQQQQHWDSHLPAAVDGAAAVLHDLQLQQKDSSSSTISSTNSGRNWESFLEQDAQQRAVEVAAALLLYFACVPRQPIKQELIKQIRQSSRTVIQVHFRDQGPQSLLQQQGTCGTQLRVELAAREQQQQQQLLLLHPTYQYAIRAAAAVLNCNWIQFWQCYNTYSSNKTSRSESGSGARSGSGFLIRCVMDVHIQRLEVQIVTAAATAYRMMPADVLLRWLNLPAAAASSSGVADGGNSSNSNARSGNGTELQSINASSSSAAVCHSFSRSEKLMQVLLAAATAGSKGCRVALECNAMGQTALPDTIMFRS